jgi:rubrerythrin
MEEYMAEIETRLKALEVALENERREREFYLKNSKRTSHPLGSKMFAEIADDELEHFQRIQELYRRLKEKGKWPETIPFKVKDTEVRSLFKETVRTLEQGQTAKSDADDLAAVKVAIEFEAKGEKFYEDLAGMTEDIQEKSFYQLLSSIEREHLLSLKDTHEYFRDPEGWYQTKERHSLDAG